MMMNMEERGGGGSALYLSNKRGGDWLGRYGICVDGDDAADAGAKLIRGGGVGVSVSRDVRKGDVIHSAPVFFRKKAGIVRKKRGIFRKKRGNDDDDNDNDPMYQYCYAIDDNDDDVKVDFVVCPMSLAAFLTRDGDGYGDGDGDGDGNDSDNAVSSHECATAGGGGGKCVNTKDDDINTYYRWSGFENYLNILTEEGGGIDGDLDRIIDHILKTTTSVTIDVIASRDIRRGELIRLGKGDTTTTNTEGRKTMNSIFVSLCQHAYTKQQGYSIAGGGAGSME